MQGVDIVKRLKEFVPKYTSLFTTGGNISSLTANTGTITATATEHGLINGSKYTINGAYEPLPISSITRDGSVITITCSVDHKQTKLATSEIRYITITGSDPDEYNGEFELLSIIDKNIITCKINTTPISPATTSGNILYASPAYNGYKTITVVDDNTFTYTTTDISLQSPATGTITYSNINIGYGATFGYCMQQYAKQSISGNYNYWLYVVIDNATSYNSKGIVLSDPSGLYDTMQTGFIMNEIINLGIYMIIPKFNSELAGTEGDIARSLESVIHRSLLGYEFTRNDTAITNRQFYAMNYIGSEGAFDETNYAFYMHKLNYACKSQIDFEYTTNYIDKYPLTNIQGNIGKMDININTRA